MTDTIKILALVFPMLGVALGEFIPTILDSPPERYLPQLLLCYKPPWSVFALVLLLPSLLGGTTG